LKDAKGDGGEVRPCFAAVDECLVQEMNVGLRMMFEPPGEGRVQLATPRRGQLADDRLADQVMGDSM